MDKSLETKIVEFLDNKTSLNKGENNCFSQKIYADYRDKLSEDSIKKILEADEPMDEFYELFGYDYNMYEFGALFKELEESFEGYEENEKEVDEWIREHVSFYIDTDHYLKETVCANIIIDTGDGNYDFTLNNLYQADEINEDSALLWLAKAQGYTKEQLEKATIAEEVSFSDSKLLKSIYQECLNTTSSMNALSFFVDMTIKDLIDYKKKPWTIKLDKDVKCGLVDYWNGAGGILEIELEKELEIPSDKVRSFKIDGADGYGVGEIFGMCSTFWTDTII